MNGTPRRARHPRRDGLDAAIADFVQERPALRHAYISMVRPSGGSWFLEIEVNDGVVAFGWDSHRVVRRAALHQAERLHALLESRGLIVHRSRATFVHALQPPITNFRVVSR